jgi:hypothetical protein
MIPAVIAAGTVFEALARKLAWQMHGYLQSSKATLWRNRRAR